MAAELLAAASRLDGMFGRTVIYPGSDEIGMPAAARARIGEKEISFHESAAKPDVLLILDHAMLHREAIISDLKASPQIILINATQSLRDLNLEGLFSARPTEAVHLLPATDIAVRNLGRPIPAAAMVGGMLAITGFPSLRSVLAAIRGRFWGSISECNEAVAQEAYFYVRSHLKIGHFAKDFAHAK